MYSNQYYIFHVHSTCLRVGTCRHKPETTEFIYCSSRSRDAVSLSSSRLTLSGRELGVPLYRLPRDDSHRDLLESPFLEISSMCINVATCTG